MHCRIKTTAWVARQLVRWLISGKQTSRDYLTATHQYADIDELDYPTALASKISASFENVVEIGAAGGGRIVAVKRAVPHISATGMDIGPDYATPRTRDGVSFRRYDPEQVPQNGLVFCVGTLNCMPPRDVNVAISAIAQRNCTLLIFEPSPPYFINCSKPRPRSPGWYHPYQALGLAHGLCARDSSNHRFQHIDSLKNFERWSPLLLAPVKA